MLLGIAGGAALMALVIWAIRSAVDGLLGLRSSGETGRKSAGFALVKFFTRHAIVALAAYVLIVRLGADPVGVIVGVSAVVVAVTIEAVRGFRWRRFL
jgi:hypothetical protein